MRRRWIRVSLGVVAALVLLVLAVRYLVPADKWMQLAFEQLEKRTGLVARAESASISFPWPLGLRLEKLAVEDPVERPGWSRLEAQVEQVVVVAELGSILRGQPNVREVRLRRPVAEIWLRAPAEEGADASAGAPADSLARPSAGSPPVAALGLLALEGARLTVHDPAGTTYELVDLDSDASLELQGENFAGSLEGQLASLRMSGGSLSQPFVSPPLRWRAQLTGRADGSRVELQLAELGSAGVLVTGPVVLEQAEGSAMHLVADVEVRAEARRLYQELGRDLLSQPGMLPPPWTLDDFDVVAGDFAGRASWDAPLPEPGAAQPLSALGVQGRVEGLRVALLGREDLLTLAADLRVSDGQLRLEQVQGAGVVGRATGQVQMPLAAGGTLDGEIGLRVDAGVVRGLAEDWWPRLKEAAGPDAAGPDTWPAVRGGVRGQLTLAWPLDPAVETPPDDALRFRSEGLRLALLLPTLRDSVHVRGGQVLASLGRAEAQGVTIAGPGFEGQVRGSAEGWPERIAIKGSVDLDRLDTDQMRASLVVPEETAWTPRSDWPEWLGGARPARAQASGSVALPVPPGNLAVDVDFTARTVMASGYDLRAVKGKARLVDQKLELPELRARLGSGGVRGAGGVDWTVDPPRWTGSARADSVPASSLLEPVAAPLAAALTTEFTGTLALDGPLLSEPARLLEALTGAAEMRSREGTLKTEQILGPKVSQFLGQRAEKWRDFDFRSLVADVRVEEGAVHFQRLFLNGDTQVQVGGKIGLDGRNDYRLDVLLPKGVTPQLGALEPLAELLRDESGRMAFGVNVSGPAAKPKVEIDFAELEARARAKGEDRARSLLQQQIDKLGVDGGGKNAQGVLDSLGAELEGDLGKQAEEAAKSLLDRLRGGKKKGGGEP